MNCLCVPFLHFSIRCLVLFSSILKIIYLAIISLPVLSALNIFAQAHRLFTAYFVMQTLFKNSDFPLVISGILVTHYVFTD